MVELRTAFPDRIEWRTVRNNPLFCEGYREVHVVSQPGKKAGRPSDDDLRRVSEDHLKYEMDMLAGLVKAMPEYRDEEREGYSPWATRNLAG